MVVNIFKSNHSAAFCATYIKYYKLDKIIKVALELVPKVQDNQKNRVFDYPIPISKNIQAFYFVEAPPPEKNL